MYDPFRPFVSGTGTDSANGWHTGPPDISVVNDWDQTFDTSGYNKDVTSYGVGGYSGTSIAGIESEWLKLELPHKIILSHFYYQHRNGESTNYHQAPRDFRILGSNDDVNWDTIKMFTGETSLPEGKILTAEASKGYKYLAFVVTKTWTVSGTSHCTLKNLEYYGVPEYDPDAHGTDVIMRSVPNVPNTDWLEVYYDGQDYTSMPSTVTDKSGNSVTGTPSGGVGFDTEYKAFTFDGVDDSISATSIGNPAGDWTHSSSFWFKFDVVETVHFYSIGPSTVSGQNITALYYAASGFLQSSVSGGVYTKYENVFLLPNHWYHITTVKRTNAQGSIYLNGNELPVTDYGNTGLQMSLPANTSLNIGTRPDQSSVAFFDGSIANFRLFNRALGADEIWQLYAYQKEYFDVSPDVVTFKGGRLGIGTLEPRAVLDVQGGIKVNNYPFSSAACLQVSTSQNQSLNQSNYQTVTFNNIDVDTINGWDATNNRYQPQVPGFYIVNAQRFNIPATSSYVVCLIRKNAVDVCAETIVGSGLNHPMGGATALVYLNGTTDYVYVLGLASTTINLTTNRSLHIIHVSF
jgi:hypothetical protein